MGLCVSSQLSPSSSTPTGTVFRDSQGSVYDTPPSSQTGRPQEMPSPRPSHLHQYSSPTRIPGGGNSDHIYAMIDSSAQYRPQSSPSSAPLAQSPEATLADLLARKEAALAEVTARRAALEEARVRVEAAKGAQNAPFARHDSPFSKAASPHQSPTAGVSSIPKGSVPSSRFSPPQRVPPLGPSPTTASFPTPKPEPSPLPLESPRTGTGDLVTIFALKEAALADVRAKREALEESKANVERLKAASQSLATGSRRPAQRSASPTRTPRTYTTKTR